MQPMSQVAKGVPHTIWAKDQPEYLPLPSIVVGDRTITKWSLSWRERIHVLLYGYIYHEQLNFTHPLQPVKMHCNDKDIPFLDITAPSYEEANAVKPEKGEER